VCFLGIDARLACQRDLDGLEDWEIGELVDFGDEFLRKKSLGLISMAFDKPSSKIMCLEVRLFTAIKHKDPPCRSSFRW